MFRKLFTLISLITAGVISYLFIDSWLEFWIFPVVYIATDIICIAIFVITAYLFTFTVKDDLIVNKYNKFYHYYLAHVLEYICAFCRIKVKVVGKEKLPKDTKYLIVQNHRSNLDPLINLYTFKNQRFSVISKPSNFKLFIAGKFMTKNGFIPINRDNNREGMKSILRAIEQIKTDEFSIMVCPEGTRNRYNKNLLPFKGGTFKIAQKANVPVVISSIDGTEKVTKRAPWRSTKVTITIIDVINPKDYDSTNAMAEYAEKIISETLGVKVHTEEELEMLKNGTYNPNEKQLTSPANISDTQNDTTKTESTTQSVTTDHQSETTKEQSIEPNDTNNNKNDATQEHTTQPTNTDTNSDAITENE